MSNILVFLYVKRLPSLFSGYILTFCKLIIRKLMHAACMSVFRLREKKRA